MCVCVWVGVSYLLPTTGYGSTELTDEQIDEISSRIMPKARGSLRVPDLLPPLRKLKALTDTEYSHLRSGSLEQEEQAARLMEYLMYKGTYGLAALYLSLLMSSESKKGLPAHYQLARELADIGETLLVYVYSWASVSLHYTVRVHTYCIATFRMDICDYIVFTLMIY